MSTDDDIQFVLALVSFAALGGLVIFQYLHYVVAAWRYWSDHPKRVTRTATVAIGWLLFAVITLGVLPASYGYVEGLPFTLLALFGPALAALVLLAVSDRFRRFADSLSLRWMIQGFAGPARMIVGIIFLFWFFAGRLPGVVAWIAGPGDWIAGFITYYAVKRLQPIADTVGITDPHWSASEFLSRRGSDSIDAATSTTLLAGLSAATICVAFGIADFIAAPASTTVAIAMHNVPEEMGNFPLVMIPHLLVPQVLVLEVLAMRQFFVLRRNLRQGGS